MPRVASKVLALAAVAGVIVLAGCGGTGPISALDREPTDQDTLPAHVSFGPPDANTDDATVRYLTENEGIKYYVAETSSPPMYCIIQVDSTGDEPAWGSFCGGETSGQVASGMVTGIPGNVTLVTDGFSTADLEESGWVQIHENVLISGA